MHEKKKVKCVVWDLDETIWSGVLLEDEKVKLCRSVVKIILELDKRGILHSIASKNNYDMTINKLKELGIYEYFLYPQINWNSKSESLKMISEKLNLSLDSFAFVDDQEYELAEVKHSYPEVLCMLTKDIDSMLMMPEMTPNFITEDSANRRRLYQQDIERKTCEESFNGPQVDFLSSLDMFFSIGLASESDLERAEELTVRTHQLNTTSQTFSYNELKEFMTDPQYRLYITSLEDKFGDYGKIGLSLVKCTKDTWTIKLFLMSCRVMSRGVGTVFLNFIIDEAKKAGVSLFAEFIHNDRNRIMYVTYKFNGFREREINNDKNIVLLEYDMLRETTYPPYVKVEILQ
ncbi:HAD-IIIC family phosphatase [Clostridium cavendishii]|nr:HAD-IIIC family phosphatase [Clostridium cavendishii]